MGGAVASDEPDAEPAWEAGSRGTYNVARLMEQHGDAKLPGLLQTLADCPKARSASIHDWCKAVFRQLGRRRP